MRKKDATRERDLTQGSMMSHYKALALPASVGMLFNTLYNIVDSYFAGMISTTAQAGLSLSFPLFLLVLAFSIGSSQALGGLVGRAKGRGDQVAARRIAAQGLGTVFIVSFAVSGLGVFFTPDLLKIIGGQGDWLAPAVDYATVIFLFAPAFLLAFGATGLLSAQGDQISGKQAGIAAFFANCLLNPALIYGFAGLPALGFTGIAVSTVVTQCATACFLLYRVVQSSVLSGVQPRDFLPSRDIMLSVCTQGLPPALNFMTTAAAFFIWQSWLQPLGAQTVAAYGIALRVEQLALLPGIGLTLAMMPILSQNFGAERFDRLRYGFWWGLCVGLTYMSGVGLVLWVGGELYSIVLYNRCGCFGGWTTLFDLRGPDSTDLYGDFGDSNLDAGGWATGFKYYHRAFSPCGRRHFLDGSFRAFPRLGGRGGLDFCFPVCQLWAGSFVDLPAPCCAKNGWIYRFARASVQKIFCGGTIKNGHPYSPQSSPSGASNCFL